MNLFVVGGGCFIGNTLFRQRLLKSTRPILDQVASTLSPAVGNLVDQAERAGDPRYVFAYVNIGDANRTARVLATKPQIGPVNRLVVIFDHTRITAVVRRTR